MATTDKEVKWALVIVPQNIKKLEGVLLLMNINKDATKTTTEYHKIKPELVKKHLKELPPAVQDAIYSLSDRYLFELHDDIVTRYNTISGKGISYESYYENAINRGIHQRFERLLTFAPVTKWYHKTWTSKKNVETAPIAISQYRPQLFFVVEKEGIRFQLVIYISLNNSFYPLSSFDQFDFWLVSKREYFLLRYADFSILKWLNLPETKKYFKDATLFKNNVIARLEVDYKVNRNGVFKEIIIDSKPQFRVLLSELSGSFLMFTPQWLYEGFLIDGVYKATHEITQAGEVYIIKRDQDAEAVLVNLLKSLHPNFEKQNNGYYYLSFADAQKKSWFLKVYHQLLDDNIELVGMDLLEHFRYSTHKANTTVSILKQEGALLRLSLAISFGNENVPLSYLQKTLLAGQRAILLKDGSLGVLSDDWLKQYGTIIKHGTVQKKEILLPRWMAMNEAAVDNEEQQVLRANINKDWWKKWEQWQQDTTVYTLPPTINAELRPYQQKGFEWMALLAEIGAGACLADDMGLGKTLQTICLLAHQHHNNPADQSIIMCPASLIYNWVQELQKFAPHFSVLAYHGGQRNFKDVLENKPNIIITTYGTIRADIEQFTPLVFGVAVVDESHNIKSPTALITRAIAQVQAKTRIALSGTPVMNNTFDLFSQLSFLLPGMFGSREFFKKEYADPIDRFNDADKIAALQKITAPFILRRTKEQVAQDLPEKVESVLWCEMGHDQKNAYDSVKEKVRNSVFLEINEKGLNAGKLGVINGMLKLRQICNSCELVKDEDLFTYESIKTEVLIDELNNLIDNHKVLVFSQFTSMLDLLEISFNKNNIPFIRLDGTTPIDKRQTLVNDFQDPNSEARVFLISLKAGNAGLNLTAADYVFLFDPWWNTAVQQQAIDRTHRIGQTQQVFAYQMICKGTIEEKIIQLQQRKKKLAQELIGEEDGFIKSLTEDDISFLFS